MEHNTLKTILIYSIYTAMTNIEVEDCEHNVYVTKRGLLQKQMLLLGKW